MKSQFLITLAILPVALAGCDPTQPSHIPNPIQLPGAVIGTGIENTFYNARRKRVSGFVMANYAGLVTEIKAGQTPLAHIAMDIARVPAPSWPVLFDELRSNPDIYLSGDPEKMVVAFMVYGN